MSRSARFAIERLPVQAGSQTCDLAGQAMDCDNCSQPYDPSRPRRRALG
jgi:hypothetical protein